MSAIFGLCYFDGRPIQPESPSPMQAIMSSWGPDGCNSGGRTTPAWAMPCWWSAPPPAPRLCRCTIPKRSRFWWPRPVWITGTSSAILSAFHIPNVPLPPTAVSSSLLSRTGEKTARKNFTATGPLPSGIMAGNGFFWPGTSWAIPVCFIIISPPSSPLPPTHKLCWRFRMCPGGLNEMQLARYLTFFSEDQSRYFLARYTRFFPAAGPRSPRNVVILTFTGASRMPRRCV